MALGLVEITQLIVTVISISAILIGIGISIYSLLLQKRETLKQNTRIIELLEELVKK